MAVTAVTELQFLLLDHQLLMVVAVVVVGSLAVVQVVLVAVALVQDLHPLMVLQIQAVAVAVLVLPVLWVAA
jgi:hypothetical protein